MDPGRRTSPPAAKGPAELRKEVLDAGLCTACGMCLGLCPYLDELGEHVAFISDCRAQQGRCYAVCPRAETDLDALRRRHFPDQAVDYVLGPHQSIWMARAGDTAVRKRGQYGGTVTALVLCGLATGQIDRALLTEWSADPEEPILPRPVVANSREQVLAAAGSKYSACPTLKVLDQTVEQESQSLFVVGRPCQVLALRKRMALDDPSFHQERIAMVAGLFCMWSLSYRKFKHQLQPLLKGQRPTRIDVPKGRFVVETERGLFELSHDSVRAQARETCQWCYDFTAEFADVSVGSTEWKDDWNTLIVRTDAARSFIERAQSTGWIELEPFPEERIRLLREAAFDKKKRVLQQLESGDHAHTGEPYLKLSQAEKDFFEAH